VSMVALGGSMSEMSERGCIKKVLRNPAPPRIDGLGTSTRDGNSAEEVFRSSIAPPDEKKKEMWFPCESHSLGRTR